MVTDIEDVKGRVIEGLIDSGGEPWEFKAEDIQTLVNWIEKQQKQVKNCVVLDGVVASDLIKVENAYIEDADVVGSYDATGRVKELWITQKEFDNIKCINN